MSTPETYTIYFGGELFSGKHLLGNAVLAEAIHHRSKGKYIPVLPQNLEQRHVSAHAIRDQDILKLLECDLGLFNYDGPELDSGTVVEFMFAKFADIPSVVVRTDFRSAGDGAQDCDPWNLMSSFFPRTKVVLQNSLTVYQKAMIHRAEMDPQVGLESRHFSAAGFSMVQQAADDVIAAYDEVLTIPPVLPGPMSQDVYRWLSVMPGFHDAASLGIDDKLQAVLATKRQRQLLRQAAE